MEERKEAKIILWEGIGKLFHYTETKYRELEDRIYHELPMPENHYAVATMLVEREDYDPINGLFFPMDTDDPGGLGREKRLRFYMEAGDSICQRALRSDGIEGELQGEGKKVRFRIKQDRRYLQRIAGLYETFIFNLVPWNTVHTGYLERFFYLEPVDGGEYEPDKLTVQWGEWEPYIRTGLIPLWNLEQIELRMSDYMVPGPDGIYYEHCIRLDDRRKEDGYLIRMYEDIVNIRYEETRIVIKTKKEEMGHYGGYRIHGIEEKIEGNLLNNAKKSSFAARYQQRTGNFIQTRMDMLRRVNEIAGDRGIEAVDFCIEEKAGENYLQADMNCFLTEPSFPEDTRKYLVFYFQKKEGGGYLQETHIRYVLSELQLEYMEYCCIGKVI